MLFLASRILPIAFAASLTAFAFDLSDDLFAAARKGDVAAVKDLLSKGADVNSKGPYDQTPLFFAADRGHLDVVKVLVEKGADLNRKDTFYNFTAIGRAAMKNHNEIVGYLAAKGATGVGQLLTQAVFGGDKELLKTLLDTKKATPKELTAAWRIADANKKPELAAMLKDAGAEPPAATITLDEASLAAFVGTYLGGRGGTEFETVVTLVDGKLKYGMQGRAFTMAPFSKTEFRLVEENSQTVEFNMTDGKATGFVFSPQGLVFTRKP